MSWFAKLRSKSVSTQNRPPTGVRSLYGKVMVDPQTCLEVFKNHWRQAYTIMCRHIPTAATIYHRVALTGDEVQAVVNYVDQMMNLLVEEETVNGKIGPMLQFLTNENIMEKLLDWSVEHSQFADEMKHEQLKVYETLLCGSPQPVLHQRHILNPLLRLLGMCSDATTLEIENHLILLLNQLCVSLYKDPSLLEQFFNAKADHGPAKFLIFSLLIPYVHREGRIGQQARDALLLCMSLSAENETVGTYIAENSNFCHVLATGLSGLYSSLPRKIEIRSDDWHALRKEDYVNAPALLMFLNSLEFCNAVAQDLTLRSDKLRNDTETCFDIEEHVQIGLVASAVPGTAVTSPRTGNGCLRAGDADVGCFGGLGCVRRWLDVDGLLPNAREEEKVPGEVHPGPDGWMADVSGPSVVSFPDQERKRSHGARWPSCAPFLAEGRCMYTEKEEDMCPLNSFNLTTNCNHWRRRH
ncbi:hypothetical protein Bbelb_269580 [Branchiostoma belcheri]|nr:hypothetical protein Bbelb_269580 [Branchiostoma belcheri]